jgi:hypothetical protein
MLAWWAWTWILIVLVLAVSASWTDLREQVPTWRVVVDACVALFTIASVVLASQAPLRRYIGLCGAAPLVIVAAGLWTIYRSVGEYRQLLSTGEISSRGDCMAAAFTSLAVGALYVPAWWLAWQALCL